MKFSNKSRDTSMFSTIGCDSDSGNSDRQPLGAKRNNKKGRRSVPTGMSFGVNDVSSLPLNEVSSPIPELCQTAQITNVPLEDNSHLENNHSTKNNSSYSQDFIKEENINNVDSSVKNVILSDKPCGNNIDGTIENNIVEKNVHAFQTCSLKVDDKEITTSNLINNNKSLIKILKPEDVKPKINSDELMKQRNSSKHRKESKSHKHKTAKSKSDEHLKHKDDLALNFNVKDFDGFDQCDINASTLNYMLYKLTTPFNDDDEMMFPIHYKGKTFVIHL